MKAHAPAPNVWPASTNMNGGVMEWWIRSQDEATRCGSGGGEWVGAAVRRARIVARRCWCVSRVSGGVVAVEEAQVQGLRSHFLHVAVLAGAAVHLARGDETAVARHLHINPINTAQNNRVYRRGEEVAVYCCC